MGIEAVEAMEDTENAKVAASKDPAAGGTPQQAGKQQSIAALVLSSLGLMADIYDFSIINLVRPNLEAEFGLLTPLEDGLLTGASLAGAMMGQIVFGAFADYFGRRLIFISTASLIALSCFCSAIAQDGVFGMSIYTSLAFIRFFMGVGVGGEYPLAAANTVENVDAESSGRALATTFAGMAMGSILAPVVVITLSALVGTHTNLVWRGAFAFGAVFASVLALFRYSHLRETNSYQATSNGPGAKGKAMALWEMRWSLAGTAGSWLLYDIVTYGVSMYSTTIFPAAPGTDSALIVLLIATLSIPGTLVAIPLAGCVRLKSLQVMGLSLMALSFVLLAQFGASLGTTNISAACVMIFSFGRCFDTGGPGMTTFAIPGQIFPTRIRGTAHGISAASGKLGAVIGTFAFPYVSSVASMETIMGLMAAVSVLTVFWTWVFVPLYTVEDLKTISKLDAGMPTERQAVLAERLLHDPTLGDKGELSPISAVNG